MIRAKSFIIFLQNMKLLVQYQNIMSQSSPQPYLCFRFEDSLRKYEPPLRKRVKKTPEPFSSSLKKKSLVHSNERMKPILGSINKYQQQSKEKLSPFSKIFHQQKEISKNEVSDFACDPIITSTQENINIWDRIQIKAKKSTFQKTKNDDKLLREKVRKCINEQISQMWEKAEKEEQQNITKCSLSQFEGIQQTIKKVEELHKELVESLESSVSEIVESVNLELEKIQQVQDDLTNPKESKEISVQEVNSCPNNEDNKYDEENPLLRENILFNGGRIKFFGQQKECYLSARIFTQAVQTSALNKVKQRHPYLESTVECLSKILGDEMEQKPDS